MSDAAFPFGTPSEPGGEDDPTAAAIERALADAGLRAGGGVEVDAAWAAEPESTWVDAGVPDDD